MNVTLGPGILDQMIAHAKTASPQEACGLLVGHGSNGTRFLRAKNTLASDSAYEIDPGFLASTLRAMRESGEQLVAIFHSHPRGPAEPSRVDLERAYYPEAAHIIVSLADPEHAQARGFRIIDGASYEIEIQVLG